MKGKLGYILSGAWCAVLVFAFVLLPHVGSVQATTAPTLEWHQTYDEKCTTSCHIAVSCEGECGDGKPCCNGGVEETWSCLYCGDE